MDKNNHIPIISIDGWVIPHRFISFLKIDRYALLNIPIVEAECNIPNDDKLTYLLKNKMFKAGFDFIGKIQEVYNFYLTDILSLTFSKEKVNTVRFRGLLDVRDLMNIPNQISFKDKTTDEVLALMQTVFPDIQYKGEDKQTWINYNVPEIQFIKELVEHSKLTNDFIIPYIGLNKELVVKKFSDISKDKSFDLTDIPIKPQVKLFTNDYLNSFLLEEAKGFREWVLVDDGAYIPKTVQQTTDVVTSDAIANASYVTDQFINIGNVYPSFYIQKLKNKQYLKNIQKYIIEVSYSQLITDESLVLLKMHKLNLKENLSEILKTEFMLMGVTKYFINEDGNYNYKTSLTLTKGDF